MREVSVEMGGTGLGVEVVECEEEPLACKNAKERMRKTRVARESEEGRGDGVRGGGEERDGEQSGTARRRNG